jgi:hypothetical protein
MYVTPTLCLLRLTAIALMQQQQQQLQQPAPTAVDGWLTSLHLGV